MCAIIFNFIHLLENEPKLRSQLIVNTKNPNIKKWFNIINHLQYLHCILVPFFTAMYKAKFLTNDTHKTHGEWTRYLKARN